MQGQQIGYRELEINNTRVTDAKVTSNIEGNKAVYTITGTVDATGKAGENNAPVKEPFSMNVEFTVTGNVVELQLTNLSENIHTVNFPNQSLVSVSSKDEGAFLAENNFNQDGKYDLTTREAQASHEYTSLAVLNTSKIAGTVNSGSYKSRSEIVFHTMDNGDETITGLWPNEFIVRGLDNDVIKDGNWAKVSITLDRNKDDKVDYQDGAIALRDDIPTEYYTNRDITNSFTSIAVNEASGVQYPFLNTLDQVKKMSLGLDDFPQMVVFKGYQSQGHDSAHPSFGDINPQAGGEEDFKTLVANAGEYNTKIGVFENFISGPNHMSEASDFTDDVIDGRYSLKILNMEGKSQNMAQTVPSTLRFPENTKCTVSVNYMVSNGGGYTLSAWEGETKLGEVALPATGMGQGANAPKAELSFTTGDTGKVQLRINRTNGTLILDNMAVQIDKNSQGAKQAITATATETEP